MSEKDLIRNSEILLVMKFRVYLIHNRGHTKPSFVVVVVDKSGYKDKLSSAFNFAVSGRITRWSKLHEIQLKIKLVSYYLPAKTCQ